MAMFFFYSLKNRTKAYAKDFNLLIIKYLQNIYTGFFPAAGRGNQKM